MIGTPDGRHTVCWDIPHDPTILAEVRGALRRALAEWALTGTDDLADEIVLAASEVLSNAVLYGLPPIRLTVRVMGDTLCAEVTDHGAGRPERTARRVRDEEAEHGRGLTIVEALSDEWGVRPAPDGSAKTVWFRKRCPHARSGR